MSATTPDEGDHEGEHGFRTKVRAESGTVSTDSGDSEHGSAVVMHFRRGEAGTAAVTAAWKL